MILFACETRLNLINVLKTKRKELENETKASKYDL